MKYFIQQKNIINKIYLTLLELTFLTILTYKGNAQVFIINSSSLHLNTYYTKTSLAQPLVFHVNFSKYVNFACKAQQ